MKQQAANAIFPGFLGGALIWAMWGLIDQEARTLCLAGAGLILMFGWSTWYRCTHDEHGRVVYPAKCLRFLTAEVKWQLFNGICSGFVGASFVMLLIGAVDIEERKLWFALAALIFMFGGSMWYRCTHDEKGRAIYSAKGYYFLSPEMAWRLWRLVHAFLKACFIVSLGLLTLAVADREIWKFCCVAGFGLFIVGCALFHYIMQIEAGQSLKPAKCLDEF